MATKSSVVKNSPSPSNDQERILNSNDDTNYTKNSMDSSCSPLDESDCSGYLEYHSTFESIKRPKNRRASTEEEDIDYSEISMDSSCSPLDESDCSGYLEYHSTFESIKRPKNRRASTEENEDTDYTENSMDSSCSPLDESDCSGYLEYHSTFESIKRPKNRRASTENVCKEGKVEEVIGTRSEFCTGCDLGIHTLCHQCQLRHLGKAQNELAKLMRILQKTTSI